jgi:hypothetical protein
MSIQNILQSFKETSAGQFPPFLIMLIGLFIGVVIGPMLLFVIGGETPVASGYPDLNWIFMAVSLLLLVGIGVGLLMFRREPRATNDISINPNCY